MISEERAEKAMDLRKRMLERRREVFRLRGEGKQMWEIAKELGVPESQVRYILTQT